MEHHFASNSSRRMVRLLEPPPGCRLLRHSATRLEMPEAMMNATSTSNDSSADTAASTQRSPAPQPPQRSATLRSQRLADLVTDSWTSPFAVPGQARSSWRQQRRSWCPTDVSIIAPNGHEGRGRHTAAKLSCLVGANTNRADSVQCNAQALLRCAVRADCRRNDDGVGNTRWLFVIDVAS